MGVLPVSPTRMELTRLKKQLQLSIRGHKLLKDKQDELMRRFVALIRECNTLRMEAEAQYTQIRRQSLLAKAAVAEETIHGIYACQKNPVTVTYGVGNMMGLSVPEMRFEVTPNPPSGLLQSTPALERSREQMEKLLPTLLELAQAEKNCTILAAEIEKIRRRVNALEYMTIPQLTETIRFIKMRLEDAERDRITRLIKMEDMSEKEGEQIAAQ